MLAHLKIISLVAILLVIAAPVDATSIVVDLNANRILVVADSRASEVGLSGSAVHDDKCKIVILGNEIAFAETGREGYTPNGPGDTAPEWHGTTEALTAYNNVADHDLYQVALAWSIQVTDDFQRFYLINPQRVRSLAVQGVLLIGLFAGKSSDGKLKVYVGRAALDDTLQTRTGALIPIGYAVDTIPMREEPISTNTVTQELLDGETNRAKKVANLWAQKSRSIPLVNRRLKWLEYIVERTGDYDPDVHSPVNAVEVRENSVVWLQNNTCQNQ